MYYSVKKKMAQKTFKYVDLLFKSEMTKEKMNSF